MAVDSVNNNKRNVLGWTLGGIGTGALLGGGAGYFFASPAKNGEFKDSFIKSSVKTTQKGVEKSANEVINIFEKANKQTNVDEIAKYIKENLTKIKGIETGLDISGASIDSLVNTIKSKELEEAKTYIAEIIDVVKEAQGNIDGLTEEAMKKTFKFATEIDGKEVKFKQPEEKAIKEAFEKCLKGFKKSRMLLWGGISAAVLGLLGLVIGSNKKNNA